MVKFLKFYVLNFIDRRTSDDVVDEGVAGGKSDGAAIHAVDRVVRRGRSGRHGAARKLDGRATRRNVSA